MAKREDGSSYDVRVTWFSGSYKIQFKEKGAARWDYDRKPAAEDWEIFLDAIERRYRRRQATYKELEEARRLVAEAEAEKKSAGPG
ncbi:MAG TPA: hypothetical protein VGZ93_05415 [Candidatus Methylacidiphilales bacterium]|nr:hypothetical protein [Candidatus Methylacidiphilales bacterium]